MKPIPRMSVQDAKTLVTNAQLTVVLATDWSQSWSPEKYGGSLFSSFGVFLGLRGLRGL